MIYEPLIEKLMLHFSGPEFGEDVLSAKKEFFDRAGILDEAAGDFEMKMAHFVDWYLLNRPLRGTGQSPLQWLLNGKGYEMGESERGLYEALAKNVHSLFEFLKLKGRDVSVRDVFSGQKYVVKDSSITDGFSRDELFEARLIPKEDTFEFSKAFCFHPAQVTKIILKEVKKVSKLPLEDRPRAKELLIIRLFKLRYKHEQYKHVDVREIYSPESTLRI